MRKSVIRHIINATGAWIPLRMLIGMAPMNLIMPFWHCISDEELAHLKNLYRTRSSQSFERDMDKLLQHFTPVTAKDVLHHVSENKSFSRPSMLISFDDGLRQVYETVAPILIRKKIPAVFFVNSGFIDNRGLFYRYKISILIDRLQKIGSPEGIYEIISRRSPEPVTNLKSLLRYIKNLRYDDQERIAQLAHLLDVDFDTYLQYKKPYMTSDQIRELAELGFEIGAHSIDHPLYALITHDEQLLQTRKSLEFVQQHVTSRNSYFAFPFSDDGVRDEFFNEILAQKEGNPDLSFGAAGVKRDVFRQHFQRIPVEDSSLGIQGCLRSEFILYALKRMVGKHYVKR